MRYLLMFYADEDAWMALSADERNAAIERIGRWFAEHAAAERSGDAPIVTDGPFVEAKEAVGSYALVDVMDREAAIAIASSWPAGGLVEVRPIDE
jgi:hypothetical protein